MPGTMTVSARASDDRRHGTRSATCIDSTYTDPLHTRTSYAFRPSFVFARPNTSHAVDKSPSTTPSNATTATMWGRRPLAGRGANPSNIGFLATGRFCHVGYDSAMEDALMHLVPLVVMDYVGPALGALLFVGVMSLVAEPSRRTVNAIILAGASGVYLSGGFGVWELTYPVIGAAIGFRALRSYRWIAAGWLIHAVWDV